MMANNYIKAINLIIRGINLIKPGSDLGFLQEISLGRIGGKGPVSGGGEAREGGTGNITPALPSMPTLPTPISGGGGSSAGSGGGGGGGGVVTNRPPPMNYFPVIDGDNPAVRRGGQYEININGGLATSAEIGQAVVNAIRAYNRSAGPALIEIA